VELFVAIFISILQFIASAFTFSADLSQVTGPVGIVGLVQDASEIGFMALLTFTAVISLNLAVINLLPFPALDGGRLIITLIEAARGKMFPTQVVNVANGLGFVLLILLMIVVTWNDIMRIAG
jgi:regulator of sigma E protease